MGRLPLLTALLVAVTSGAGQPGAAQPGGNEPGAAASRTIQAAARAGAVGTGAVRAGQAGALSVGRFSAVLPVPGGLRPDVRSPFARGRSWTPAPSAAVAGWAATYRLAVPIGHWSPQETRAARRATARLEANQGWAPPVPV